MKVDPRIEAYAANVAAQESRFPPRSRKELFIHFGHWDDPARATPDSFLDAQDRLNEQVLALAELAPGLAVLDVGCGFGGTIAAINERCERMTLVGLNLDPRQISLAERSVRPARDNEIRWAVGDACELPFPEGRFDRVLAVECIVHFSRRRFLAEAARVLRPGGRLVISDIVPTPELRRVRDMGALPVGEAEIAAVFDAWSDFWGKDADYVELAGAAGLRIATRIDATVATLPSFAMVLGEKAGASMTDPGADGETRLMLALEWLFRCGAVRMEYLALTRDQC
jgi:SAM-dependent methyltransferase